MFKKILSSVLVAVATMAAPVAQALEVGDAAPAVTLNHIMPDDSESSLNVESRLTAGQNFILVEFFSITCGPCIRNLPTISSLATDVAATTQTRLVAIDRDPAAVRTFVGEHRDTIHFPVALDHERFALRAYGVRATPTIFIVNDQQQIVYKHVGTLSAQDVQEIRNLVQ